MERLRKKKDFEATFQNGKRFFSPYGTTLFLSHNAPVVRVGIIVGVKTAKKAVVRNRIRRRIREALRAAFQERPLARGMDIVVLPKVNVLDAPFEALKKEIAELISRMTNF